MPNDFKRNKFIGNSQPANKSRNDEAQAGPSYIDWRNAHFISWPVNRLTDTLTWIKWICVSMLGNLHRNNLNIKPDDGVVSYFIKKNTIIVELYP